MGRAIANREPDESLGREMRFSIGPSQASSLTTCHYRLHRSVSPPLPRALRMQLARGVAISWHIRCSRFDPRRASRAVPLAGCWLGWQGSPSISTREVGWGRWQGKLRPRDRAPEWLGRVMSKNIGIFFFVSTSATLLILWDKASRVRAREGLFYSFYGLW